MAPRDLVGSDALPQGESVEILHTDDALGFADANLAGLAASPRTEFVALVNDDAIVGPGWARALIDELDAHPRAAAAQGLVLTMGADSGDSEADCGDDGGETVDGAGLAWNRWWQAVQRDHGRPCADRSESGESSSSASGSREIFGVSATAAMFRRSALDEVGPLFDPTFGSYYEDVDLAVRLRAAGWSARLVPAARARHAGSTTGRHLGAARWIRRNRYAVLARALGVRLLPRLPWVVLRDVVDAGRAALRFDLGEAGAIARGSFAGLLRLPGCLRVRGLVPTSQLRRWMEDR